MIRISPGSKILVRISSGEPVQRYFVTADDSSLTVLNLRDAGLSPAVIRKLRSAVSGHTEFFAHAPITSELVTGDLHVRQDGVFIANQKVADLSLLVQRLSSTDVILIEPGPRIASSFAQLTHVTAPSEIISIMDPGGIVSRGTIARSPERRLLLTVGSSTREYTDSDVLEVRKRYRDSVANGAVNGALVGAGLGFLKAWSRVEYNWEGYAAYAVYPALGAALERPWGSPSMR